MGAVTNGFRQAMACPVHLPITRKLMVPILDDKDRFTGEYMDVNTDSPLYRAIIAAGGVKGVRLEGRR